MSKQKYIQSERKHIHKSAAYILAWIGMLVGIATMIFSICIRILPQYIDNDVFSRWYYIIWFDWLEQFTIQNNFLLIIFYALWLFAFKTKIFNSNKFLVFVTSWIVLVFAVAWFMMSPVYVLQGAIDVSMNIVIDNVFIHLVTPGLFVIFFSFASKYPKANVKNIMKFSRTWCLAFIYPLLYFTYVIIINFIKLPDDAFNAANPSGYVSVYTILTNYNPQCIVPQWSNGHWIYDNTTNMAGSYWRLLIVPVVLIFYSVELLSFTYLNNRRNNAYLPGKKINTH
ncbi:MAG: DUF1600 domain-containing protein [Mycoplasmataceae bacterium]|jgi:hypothetical protein|nr:DUF1600 domain-containing protein [Mycoplasmataceae bacterium]